MKALLIALILKLLFYRSREMPFSDIEKNEYDKLYDEAIESDGIVRYTSSFPKHRFLQYIASNRNVLLHGSNNPSIQEFEPRQQTLYNGQLTNAVFATRDGLWAIFYAVFNKNKLAGNIRNACLQMKDGDKYYYFSITHETHQSNPWTEGTVYFLPDDTFIKSSNEMVSFDEWVSERPVRPLARIEIDISDFYFRDKVSVHNSQESLFKTWALYKFRIFASKLKRTGNSQ